MIKGVIIVNNLGVVRLAKFYEQVHVTGESAEQAQQAVWKSKFYGACHRRDACSMAWTLRLLGGLAGDGDLLVEFC